MRFRAEQHLRRASEIRGVREQGRRVECRAFTLWWRKRPAEAPVLLAAGAPRVCVIASTDAVGNAVRRNDQAVNPLGFLEAGKVLEKYLAG